MQRDREIAKEILVDVLKIDEYHDEVRNWIVDKLEKYLYNNYRYYKRKVSYIEYITQLYVNRRGIKAIRNKYEKLLFDLRRTQARLYQQKNIVVKQGTRAWAATHLPPPQTQMQDFLPPFDEIGVAKPIWESNIGINVKVSHMQRLI